jgi:hypothetical protein
MTIWEHWYLNQIEKCENLLSNQDINVFLNNKNVTSLTDKLKIEYPKKMISIQHWSKPMLQGFHFFLKPPNPIFTKELKNLPNSL